MAITFDNAAAGGLTGSSSHTFSFTVGSGSDRFLVVYTLIGSSSDTLTSVTYNGVAMTLIAKVQEASGNWNYLHGLAAPASGAHDVVGTASAATAVIMAATAYAGVGSVDASATNTSASVASAGTFTLTVTTGVANCWTVGAARAETSLAPTASTGWTFRADASSGSYLVGDSGADLSAGSNSMLCTNAFGSSQPFVGIIASLAPAGGGGGGNPWHYYAQLREQVKPSRWLKHGLIWTPSYAFGKVA